MNFTLLREQEAGVRLMAEIAELPGALAYGATQDEASCEGEAVVLRVLAEQLEHGEKMGPTTS